MSLRCPSSDISNVSVIICASSDRRCFFELSITAISPHSGRSCCKPGTHETIQVIARIRIFVCSAESAKSRCDDSVATVGGADMKQIIRRWQMCCWDQMEVEFEDGCATR